MTKGSAVGKKTSKPAKSAAGSKSGSSAKSASGKGKSAPAGKKPSAPPPSAVKAPVKPAAKSAPAPAKVAAPAASNGAAIAAAASSAGGFNNKAKPKGITIVAQKAAVKKAKVKKPVVMPSLGAPLLGPGAVKKWKPLIPSGPNAPKVHTLGHAGENGANRPKSPFGKKELDLYKAILMRKRGELVGDVSTMEGEALMASSGSLSHLPQHMAEQGSEAYDQALSLDLAAVDRTLIKEIDDAIQRINDGVYGVCEMTGKPISKERLEELPWTRFSIEAARERERRSFRA